MATVFLDIERADDNVDFNILSKRLVSLRIQNKFINFIYILFNNRSIQLKFNNHIFDDCRFTTRKGLPQGSVLSPVLYSLYCSNISRLFSNHISTLEFADDLVISSLVLPV